MFMPLDQGANIRKRQKAKGRRQKGKRQKAKGRRQKGRR